MKVAELNETIDHGDMSEYIRIVEYRQHKELSRLADTICVRGTVRVVLLAGASSAGKTTSAKRLCTQLRVNGWPAMLLSTDDYFVGDKRNPRDENGELDYEHIDCVDRVRLLSDMAALLRGESVRLRRFDFQRHDGYDADVESKLPRGGVIVLEGIHALNPLMSVGLDQEAIFRLYVEPKPNVEMPDGTMPSPAEARFLRRMVRDSHFRKIPPAATLRMWPKVMAGEERWILPYRDCADARFDSYLEYEMSVLKTYVGGLLNQARNEAGDDPLLQREWQFLNCIHSYSDKYVPGDSILRETIGNSQLEY